MGCEQLTHLRTVQHLPVASCGFGWFDDCCPWTPHLPCSVVCAMSTDSEGHENTMHELKPKQLSPVGFLLALHTHSQYVWCWVAYIGMELFVSPSGSDKAELDFFSAHC